MLGTTLDIVRDERFVIHHFFSFLQCCLLLQDLQVDESARLIMHIYYMPDFAYHNSGEHWPLASSVQHTSLSPPVRHSCNTTSTSCHFRPPLSAITRRSPVRPTYLANMEEQVHRLVEKAWTKFQDTPKSQRLIIGVAGIPGSGMWLSYCHRFGESCEACADV